MAPPVLDKLRNVVQNSDPRWGAKHLLIIAGLQALFLFALLFVNARYWDIQGFAGQYWFTRWVVYLYIYLLLIISSPADARTTEIKSLHLRSNRSLHPRPPPRTRPLLLTSLPRRPLHLPQHPLHHPLGRPRPLLLVRPIKRHLGSFRRGLHRSLRRPRRLPRLPQLHPLFLPFLELLLRRPALRLRRLEPHRPTRHHPHPNPTHLRRRPSLHLLVPAHPHRPRPRVLSVHSFVRYVLEEQDETKMDEVRESEPGVCGGESATDGSELCECRGTEGKGHRSQWWWW